MISVTGYNPDRNTGPFALAASPARYVVERGDWQAAAQLPLRPSKFGYADAMIHFARALGAIRSGRPDAARPDIARLAELRDELFAGKDTYWSGQVDIQWRMASAWLLQAKGKADAALSEMRAAAAAEDLTDKATVTPGPLAPARELYGELLLERGMPREALAAYEETIAKESNRYRGIAGAARAAALVGDKQKATTYYQICVRIPGGISAAATCCTTS